MLNPTRDPAGKVEIQPVPEGSPPYLPGGLRKTVEPYARMYPRRSFFDICFVFALRARFGVFAEIAAVPEFPESAPEQFWGVPGALLRDSGGPGAPFPDPPGPRISRSR